MELSYDRTDSSSSSDELKEKSALTDELKEKIKKDCSILKFIEQTPEIVKYALEVSPHCLSYIENHTDEMLINSLDRNGIILHFKNPSASVVKHAIEKNHCYLNFQTTRDRGITLFLNQDHYEDTDSCAIENLSHEMLQLAVSDEGTNLLYIQNWDDILIRLALENDGHMLFYIRDPTPEFIEIAIRSNGCAIKHVKDPSYELKKMAVQSNGDAIRYIEPGEDLNGYEELCRYALLNTCTCFSSIKNPTYEIKKLAVGLSGYNIVYIEEQTDELVTTAIKNNPQALCHVKNPSYEHKRMAVQMDGTCIRIIKDPNNELLEIAVKNTFNALDWIENPSDDLIILGLRYSSNIPWIPHKLRDKVKGLFKRSIMNNSEPDESICSICLTELDANVYKTGCGHKFHVDCIKATIDNECNCPLCKKKFC